MTSPIRHASPTGPEEAGRERTVHVIQGECEISSDPGVVLSTLLGSCVAVCLRDPLARIGGMNHFLLPSGGDGEQESRKYGAYAMEVLINKLLRRGADRRRFEAKIFGGGRITAGLTDVGAKNVEFAQRFLATEGIGIQSQSVGGVQARRVKFWPVNGRARQMLIAPDETLVRREAPVAPPAPPDDDIEFF